MKVAILTQPLGHNYGGLLQAYALQQMLIKFGHDAETMDRHQHKTSAELFKRRMKSYLSFLRGKARLFPRGSLREQVFRNLGAFKTNMLKLSPGMTSSSQMCDYFAEKKFDAVIVGSDQVWRPEYSPELGNFYLDFLDTIRSQSLRISYAASFGVDIWEYSAEATVQCKKLVEKFDNVSVREKAAVKLCEEYFGIEATWVLDPTLCIAKEQYLTMIDAPAAHPDSQMIFEYFLDTSKEKTAIRNRAADLLKMKPFSIMPVNSLAKQTSPRIGDYIYPSVNSWLQSFRDSKYIITDSFHGCVFSIIFNKPFIAIANSGRGNSRFESLLSLFGLESRLVRSENDVTAATVSAPIDWEKVNKIREEQAIHSRNFLENALEISRPSSAAA